MHDRPTDQGAADTQSVFAELICTDPELLRAEFDALIAANYPSGDGRRLPPRRPGPPWVERTRPKRPTGVSPPSGARSDSDGRTSRVGTDRTIRERGPP